MLNKHKMMLPTKIPLYTTGPSTTYKSNMAASCWHSASLHLAWFSSWRFQKQSTILQKGWKIRYIPRINVNKILPIFSHLNSPQFWKPGEIDGLCTYFQDKHCPNSIMLFLKIVCVSSPYYMFFSVSNFINCEFKSNKYFCLTFASWFGNGRRDTQGQGLVCGSIMNDKKC